MGLGLGEFLACTRPFLQEASGVANIAFVVVELELGQFHGIELGEVHWLLCGFAMCDTVNAA